MRCRVAVPKTSQSATTPTLCSCTEMRPAAALLSPSETFPSRSSNPSQNQNPNFSESNPCFFLPMAAPQEALPQEIATRIQQFAREDKLADFQSLLKGDSYLLQKLENYPDPQTPLHIAVQHGKTSFARVILRLQPSLAKKRNNEHLLPIHLAVRNAHVPCFRMLASEAKETLEFSGPNGETVIHQALHLPAESRTMMLSEIVQTCPESLCFVDGNGKTVFHLTLETQDDISFNCLMGLLLWSLHPDAKQLKKKVLNAEDHDGNTLLHIAARRGLEGVVKNLIDNGADVNSVNFSQQSPLDLAVHGVPGILKSKGGVPFASLRPQLTEERFRHLSSKFANFSKIEKGCFRCLIFQRNASFNRRTIFAMILVMIASGCFGFAYAYPTIFIRASTVIIAPPPLPEIGSSQLFNPANFYNLNAVQKLLINIVIILISLLFFFSMCGLFFLVPEQAWGNLLITIIFLTFCLSYCLLVVIVTYNLVHLVFIVALLVLLTVGFVVFISLSRNFIKKIERGPPRQPYTGQRIIEAV
ncbi:Transmembrane protein [Trema orientale]|uniref:Transmembrane protein n=1 Tax=Trema orientale TaxID=63057 RepID=A0A2P5E8I3_TREOI|nr:Transmembrane protein [Trema orientale]